MVHFRPLWKPFDIDFESASNPINPYAEVDVTVTLHPPSGKDAVIQAFWDGGNIWKARFAPDEEGIWEWESHAEPIIEGLDLKRGRFNAIRTDSDNPFYKHGFITIHESQRAFTHSDGTPFFWMADTAWSIPSTVEENELDYYLLIRAQQGFNVVQMNSLPQHDSSVKRFRFPFHFENNEWDLDRPNIEYFQILDSILSRCLNAGILPALVVLWFDYVPQTNVWWELEKKAVFSADQAGRYARYLAARTSAFGTIYLISGDSDFETPEAMNVYNSAGSMIRQTNYYQTPISAHINGEIMSPDSLNSCSWLDFHMYQSGHSANGLLRSSTCAVHASHLMPARPVLNSEPMYDHRYYLESEKKSPDRALLRRIYWTSWFSGATAGISYGAHGVWSWDRHPIKPDWRTLLMLSSASDAVQLRMFLEQYPWWQFEPITGLIQDTDILCMIAREAGYLMVYLTKPVDSLVINIASQPTMSTWFALATGEIFEAAYQYDKNKLSIEIPAWIADAILVLKYRSLLTPYE
jgi:hypothetical protein